MPKILITDKTSEEVREKLKELGEVVYQPENVAEHLKDADVLVVRSATKVTEEFLSDLPECPKLKLVIRAGVATDNIDKEACLKRNI